MWSKVTVLLYYKMFYLKMNSENSDFFMVSIIFRIINTDCIITADQRLHNQWTAMQ